MEEDAAKERERRREAEKKLRVEFEGVPVRSIIPAAWKATFDSLKCCVKYPDLCQQTTNLLFKSLNEYLELNTAVLLPNEADYRNIKQLQSSFVCYKEFLNGISNMFFRLLTQTLGKENGENILEFYKNLLNKLHGSNEALFLHLMTQIVRCLEIIVDTYTLNPNPCMPVIMKMFVMENVQYLKMSFVPKEAFSSFVVHTLYDASELVIFCTKLTYTFLPMLKHTELNQHAADVLCKRFTCVAQLGFKEIIEENMIKTINVEDYPEMLNVLDTLLCMILGNNVDNDPKNKAWSTIEMHIMHSLFNAKDPWQPWSKMTAIHKLKNEVIRSPLNSDVHEKRDVTRCLVLTHVIRSCPGLVKMTESEIKWLSQAFCRESTGTVLSVLMGYMESELQTALPLLVAKSNLLSSDKQFAPKRSHSRSSQWYNAENYSAVWVVMKELLLICLERLAAISVSSDAMEVEQIELEKTPKSAKSQKDLLRVCWILKELTLVSCNLEKIQYKNKDQTVNVCFHFFPNQLESMVKKFVSIPLNLLPPDFESIDDLDTSHMQWEEFLDLLRCFRQLTEVWHLNQKELCCLDALSGLLWCRRDDREHPYLDEDYAETIYKYSELLTATLAEWNEKDDDYYDLDDVGLIIRAFFTNFHQVKGRATLWRANVLQQCLNSRASAFKSIAISNVPIVLTSCHRDEVPKLLSSLAEMKQISNLDVALALAETIPLIVCALSGHCDVVKVSEIGNYKSYMLPSVNYKVVCHECDEEGKNLNPKGWNLLHLWDDFLGTWLYLLEHSNANVRKTIARGIHRVCTHLGSNVTPSDVRHWMKLLQDDVIDVSSEIAVHIPLLFISHSQGEKHTQVLFEIVFEELKNATFESIWRRSPEQWQVILTAIQSIIKLPLSFILIPMAKLIALLVALGNENCYHVNHTMISQLAAVHNISPKVLFWQINEDVWKIIVNTLTIIPNKERDIKSCLKRFSYIFGVEETRLKRQLYRLLIQLIPKCLGEPVLNEVVKDISFYVETTKQMMIRKWFVLIYPVIQLEQTLEVAEECMELMTEWMRASPLDITKKYSTLMISRLMNEFSTQPDRVLHILSRMFVEQNETDEYPTSSETLKKLLVPHYLGILVNLQNIVIQKYVGDDMKLKALDSLTSLIKFMGRESFSPYRLKILNSLCTFTCLTNPHLCKSLCKLVDVFVQNVEKDLIKQYAMLIMTCVMHLDWNTFYNDIKPIVDHIFINLIEDIQNFMLELCGASEFLKHFGQEYNVDITRRQLKTGPYSQALHFKTALLCSRHEKSKLLGLKSLKAFVLERQEDLQNDLFGCSRCNPELRLALGKLLDHSASSNSEIRTLCLDSLACFGAIDPKHWIVTHGFHFETVLNQFYLDAMCPSFAAATFDILTEELQAISKDTDMDLIIFACQEYMKALDFQDEPHKAPIEIWNLICESIRLAITPYFKSNYTASIDIDVPSLPHPIFGSSHATTLESWLFNWVCRLIEMIQNPKAKKAFSALKWIFKLNLSSTKFFLPHIFMYAVWSATLSDTIKILDEMKAAAKLSTNGNDDNLEATDIMFQSLNLTCTFQTFSSGESNSSFTSLQVKTSQIIYFLLDYMMRWKLEFERMQQAAKEVKDTANPVTLGTKGKATSIQNLIKTSQICALGNRHKAVQNLLSKLSLVDAAESSHRCNENFRSLRYLEMHVVNNMPSLQDNLNLFLRVYAQLQEEDGVRGVVATMDADTNVTEQILVHEMTGQLQDAVMCYETLIGNNDPQPEILRNMARAYLGLCEYHSALAFAEKYSKSSNLSGNDFMVAVKLEVLWSMGEWELLEQELAQNKFSRPTFAYDIAHVLVAMRCGNLATAKQHVSILRTHLGDWLHKCSFKSDVYAHHYNVFVFNHISYEMEVVISLIESHAASLGSSSQGEEMWSQQVQTALDKIAMHQRRVSNCWRSMQQLLGMRRILFYLLHEALKSTLPQTAHFINQQIGALWLDSAKIAISHRQFPQALNHTFSADKYDMKEAFVLRAQIEWETGKRDRAIVYLKRGISSHFPNEAQFKRLPATVMKEERLICAKARLLIAEYSNELKIVSPLNSVRLYKDAMHAYPYSEESWVKYSRAWQVLKSDKSENNNDETHLKMLSEEIRGYSQALTFGIKYLYESLPRCISIWANIGLSLHKQNIRPIKSSDAKILPFFFKQFNDIFNNLQEVLPLYAFYACFTHLSSRLCHPYRDVYLNIQSIFLNLMDAFPHQMLWKLVPMLKLSHALRVNRVQEVLIQFKRRSSKNATLVEDYIKLVDQLYDFGFSIPKIKSLTNMRNLAPNLTKLFKQGNFGPILMPARVMLTVTLPGEDVVDYKSHNPFPRKQLFMTGVGDKVEIINSLQRPKKFGVFGSDGLKYNWLIKTKDDLRIDGLVMEFMQVLNTLLKQDPECKERSLECETYSVVPLGEDCGLIEWLPDLVPLRDTIYKIYKGMGLKQNIKHEIKKSENQEEMKRIFEEYWLPSHPPVLGTWYVQQFPDNTFWHTARLRFVYSTATMSMVGYILGLGDRHGGNIMLHVPSGKTVHVDFNCLFNKGENLPWPEKVPFRLTQNLVRCMGGTGTEGVFRHTCELVLRLIRQNMNTLLAVVRPVLYDASRKDRLDQASTRVDEFCNDALMPSLNRIKLRMCGYVNDKERANGSNESILSPEGHAQAIIKYAMDNRNLCQMYPGWGAFT